MPTLTINVNYDTTNSLFFFFLSYTDPDKVVWLSTINDGGILQFVEDGQLRMTNNDKGHNRSRTFQFDAIEVQLGHTLAGFASQQCGSSDPFDLSSIPFPKIHDGERKGIVAQSWCQQIPTADGKKSKIFKDPKLGLSNTKSDTAVGIEPSCWQPRTCTCSSS